MNFTQVEFLLLFTVVYLAYLGLRSSHRAQNLLLLAASYFFYAWFDWRFCGLLLFTTAIDFYCALVIDSLRNQQDPKPHPGLAKLTLAISICSNLAVLGFFKCFGFFSDSLLQVVNALGIDWAFPILSIALPAGISFYTFQSMSYTIDVYDGEIPAATNFFDFALYVSFFPHLVAGPIMRGASLMPQVLKQRAVTREGVLTGIQLALYGFFLKLVIADNMATIVDPVFRQPVPRGAALIIATYAFAFQIYCDFMGYTHIARGIARMMGFELVLNFNLPYFAVHPQEFWSRWHISLSTWLRDYLYIRLGGNRRGTLLTYRNLLLTMVLGGLWHGAAANFVVWGLYHGGLLVGWHGLRASKSPLLALMGVLAMRVRWLAVIVFFQLTCIGWLIFRARGLSDLSQKMTALVQFTQLRDFWTADAVRVVLFCMPLVAFELYQWKSGNLEPWVGWPSWLRVGWYVALLAAIAQFKAPQQPPFIYFQF